MPPSRRTDRTCHLLRGWQKAGALDFVKTHDDFSKGYIPYRLSDPVLTIKTLYPASEPVTSKMTGLFGSMDPHTDPVRHESRPSGGEYGKRGMPFHRDPLFQLLPPFEAKQASKDQGLLHPWL